MKPNIAMARIVLMIMGFALTFGLAEIAARIFEPKFDPCEEPQEAPGTPVIQSLACAAGRAEL